MLIDCIAKPWLLLWIMIIFDCVSVLSILCYKILFSSVVGGLKFVYNLLKIRVYCTNNIFIQQFCTYINILISNVIKNVKLPSSMKFVQSVSLVYFNLVE